jgi:HEAT repeat protein
MNPKFFVSVLLLMSFAGGVRSQLPVDVHVKILKAEDARRYDKTLEDLLASPNAQVRRRAALAAGRIGDERAITALVKILDSPDADIVAFALGEIESIQAADAILKALNSQAETPPVGSVSVAGNTLPTGRVSAFLIEAAGKIAAANPKEEKSKELGKAILATAGKATDRETILLGLTAFLRARPEGTDAVAAKFLTHTDARVRADAANTLARVRAKNANEALRNIALFDADDNARVNAIRALGAAEDKDALSLLIEAAAADKSANIRIAAIRSLAGLKDAKSADRLIDHGEKLLAAIGRTVNDKSRRLAGGLRPPTGTVKDR